MNKKYFTLFEVVLIFCTLMVLTCLSATAVRRWKPSSQEVACAANLRKLGQGTFMYTSNSKNFLPGTSELDTNWKMKLLPYLGIKSTQWDPKAYAVFNCPSNNSKLPLYKAGVDAFRAKNSYCANFYIIDFDLVDKNQDDYVGGRNLKDLWGPDTIILYAEDHDGNNTVGQGESVKWNKPGVFSYKVPKGGSYHNFNRNNFLMLDGAVEARNIEDCNVPEDLWMIRYGKTWDIGR
jgi:hypothetical protein